MLRLGGATGVRLVLHARNAEVGIQETRGDTHGEPARLLELAARDESFGRLGVFANEPLDTRALDALVAHGSLALANARAHEAALLRADRDDLTGIANYGRVMSVLEHELERAHRYGRALAVIIFDIDGLKRWNDLFGHEAGNVALVGVATLLRQRSRLSDTAGRYGGDEFVLVLPETTTDGAVAVAEKVRTAFESRPPSGDEAPLTVSAGVASAPADGKTAAELMAAADARLYRAKAEGRNRVIA